MKKSFLLHIIMVVYMFGAAVVYDVELSFNDNDTILLVEQSFIATADSISEVAFFCGKKIIPDRYKFWIEDSNGSQISGFAYSDSAGLFEHELVFATFNPKFCVKKGIEYRLAVKHNQDSLVNFYYNRTNPYKEGRIYASGIPDTCDLAARIIGINEFRDELFGMNAYVTFSHSQHSDTTFWARDKWRACIDSMKSVGVTWDRVGQHAWQHFQPLEGDTNRFRHEWCDSLMQLYADDSINVLWLFSWSTAWARCETMPKFDDWYEPFPKNLFEPVVDTSNDSINPDNYFGQYVYKFVQRYGPDGVYWNNNTGADNPVQYYEMWNEPDNAIRRGWWDSVWVDHPPYNALINSLGDTTSLIEVYSRLCIVGDSAAREASNSVYTLAYLPYHHYDTLKWPRPDVWLQGLSAKSVYNYCDGMSFHSYAIPGWTDPLFHNRQKQVLDSVWIFMKDSDFSDKFLWCTEHSTGCYPDTVDSVAISFPVQTDEQLATLCTFCANDFPKGPLTHSFLWSYTHLYFFDHEINDRLFCLTRDSLDYRPPGYGWRQLTSLLKDCRFNNCLVPDNLYDTVRVYEFENPQTDKRIYVCWKEWEVDSSYTFKLPLRTNAGKVDSIAYDNSPGTYTKAADQCGWVTLDLDTVPIYVSEPADSVLRRPDLVIDSVWTVPPYPRDGDSVLAYAMLRNIDTVTATPDTIFVKFYYNDTLIGTDIITDEIKPESTLVSSPDDTVLAAQGLHLGKAVANATRKFVEHNFNNNAHYRLYDIPLRPYGSIKINHDSTYSNFSYVVLNLSSTNPNDTLNPPADSMKLWQYYGDSLNNIDSTGWTVYDSTYFWYLRQGEATNTIYVQYKVGKENDSYEYSDSIIYDKTTPTGSFVINNDDKFTNTSSVTLKNSLTDTQSAMSEMRFGNKFLKNILKNSGFDTTSHWVTDTARYDDSLELYEIPLQEIGNYFYQAIAPESLADFVNDTLLLWIDLVSDSFVGDAWVAFKYIYGDDTTMRGTHPFGDSVAIPEGTNATVSHYNLYSYFKYYPNPQGGQTFIEARVGVFADSALGNSGKLFIDNLRLDVVSPADDYTRFEDYDTLKEWTLISGNGVRKVYGQFSEGAGNETAVSFDSIIVDTTKPASDIVSPQSLQTISGTIAITGWAHDSLDHPQHFKQYELQQKQSMTGTWSGIEPESLFTTPVYSYMFPPDTLGLWNTTTVTDGWYDLKLTVTDSAGNSNSTTVNFIQVDNGDLGEEGKFTGFSNYVYGLAAGDEVFIGELGTGKIYRYDTTYQVIDTFTLSDSVGIGFPLAMALDDSNELWVTNVTSHLVNRFTPQGSLLLRFAGGFSKPSGIAFDNSGNIWVSDRLHHKIKKFNQDGDSLFAFGRQGSEPGDIDKPIGIAFYDDKLYIADSRNKRVSIFDTLGNFISVIGDSTLFQMPFGLVVDSTGCLFVSDFLGNRVIEFDPYGNRLFTIDTLLDGPTELALSPNAYILYVSDTKHKQVLAFAVRSEPPNSGGGP